VSTLALIMNTVAVEGAAVNKLSRVEREVQAAAKMAVTVAIGNDAAGIMTRRALLYVNPPGDGFFVVTKEIGVLKGR
jgi:hypothetical protein